MYRMRSGIKEDSERLWSLPDRIFFGNGACQILAGVFLEEMTRSGFYAERVIPGDGFAGNHIFVTNGTIAFDYRGYSARLRLLEYHTTGWSNRYSQGWNCVLENVNFDLLTAYELNQRKMLGPDQYLHDPIPRARSFIERIDHQKAAAKALTTA